MNFLSFVFGILCLISIDTIAGFLIYIIWKYIDSKYFSKLELTLLQNENEYLKQENKKIQSIYTDNKTEVDTIFWSDKQ